MAPALAAPKPPGSFTRDLPIPYTSVPVGGLRSGSTTTQGPSVASNAAGRIVTLFGFPPDVVKCKQMLEKTMKYEWQSADVDLSKTASKPWDDVLGLVRQEADSHMAVITKADEATRIVQLKALGKVQLLTASSAVKEIEADIIARALNDEVSVVYPKEWEPPYGGLSDERLVEVKKDSEEWCFVEREFRDGNSIPNKLVQVQRVQNADTWERYYKEVKALASKKKAGGGSDLFERANERWMKHGTSKTDPKIVCDHYRGIDCAHSSEDCYYGKATYTAEDADYSHRYRYEMPEGKKAQMLLVRVAAGKIQEIAVRTAAHKQLKYPDYGFDSVRGDVLTGRMAIMVYKPDLAYPAYVLTYEL